MSEPEIADLNARTDAAARKWKADCRRLTLDATKQSRKLKKEGNLSGSNIYALLAGSLKQLLKYAK